ncbi:hypothetical protein D3C86_1890390 [compost metagenome]
MHGRKNILEELGCLFHSIRDKFQPDLCFLHAKQTEQSLGGLLQHLNLNPAFGNIPLGQTLPDRFFNRFSRDDERLRHESATSTFWMDDK